MARVRRATTRFFDRERGSGCCCLSHDFVCTLAHALLSQNNQNNQRVSIGVLALYVYSRVRMACACRVLAMSTPCAMHLHVRAIFANPRGGETAAQSRDSRGSPDCVG